MWWHCGRATSSIRTDADTARYVRVYMLDCGRKCCVRANGKMNSERSQSGRCGAYLGVCDWDAPVKQIAQRKSENTSVRNVIFSFEWPRFIDKFRKCLFGQKSSSFGTGHVMKSSYMPAVTMAVRCCHKINSHILQMPSIDDDLCRAPVQ